jgi:hypothetical protein
LVVLIQGPSSLCSSVSICSTKARILVTELGSNGAFAGKASFQKLDEAKKRNGVDVLEPAPPISLPVAASTLAPCEAPAADPPQPASRLDMLQISTIARALERALAGMNPV